MRTKIPGVVASGTPTEVTTAPGSRIVTTERTAWYAAAMPKIDVRPLVMPAIADQIGQAIITARSKARTAISRANRGHHRAARIIAELASRRLGRTAGRGFEGRGEPLLSGRGRPWYLRQVEQVTGGRPERAAPASA